jgi:hypothetical protein
MKTLAVTLWLIFLGLLGFDQFERWQARGYTIESVFGESDAREELLFVDYEDSTLGFSMVVPKQWSRLIPDHSYEVSDDMDAGYSVIFESPLEGEQDSYADYIMIEVLPGIDTGAFESTGEHRGVVIVDGQQAVRDELTLLDFPVGGHRIDLLVKQAEIAQLGYTVGLYVIGTNNNAQMLDEAFRALLYSFQLPKQPYLVSQAGY